ncbi:ficolin-2-like [Anopheles ziemanni]|uniref:ficolin-2-like n=1 Tax=Anopheles ziemanni TaxID=345580 RepID=UPI00265FC659|nr:ficolin-2-like [Anopheles ziemanni]
MLKLSVLIGLMVCLETVLVQCASNESSSVSAPSGFSFEMIMTKLQVLEYHIIKKDLQADERITVLASNVKSLVRDFSVQRESRYTSCSSLPFRLSGIYQIQPEKPFKEPMSVLCDQEYESGGWTVIQHRFDGSVNFFRGWQEYKNGFGSLEGEFWLGLDRIHQLTASKPHELLIVLEDYDGNKTYAKYDRFEIGDEGQKYVLKTLGTYSGTAGDSFSDLNGMKFSTLDADNDTWGKNCAVEYTGAWWYTACHHSNLNGRYLSGATKESWAGMVWHKFRGEDYSLKSSKMMIRQM